MKNTNFYRTLTEIKGYMKPMSFPQRISYLWYTFKVYVPVALVVAIMLATLTFSILNLNTEILLTGSLINFPASEEGYEYLTEGYGEKVGAVKYKQEVQISQIDYSVDNADGDYEYNYQTSSRLYAMAAGEMLDFLLMSKGAMQVLMPEQMYMDLRDILTEEELKQWEGRIVYCEFEDERGSVPVALDIVDTQFAKDCLPKGVSYYLSFILTTPRKEACRDYLAYILAWDGSQKATQPTTE